MDIKSEKFKQAAKNNWGVIRVVVIRSMADIHILVENILKNWIPGDDWMSHGWRKNMN